MLVNLKKNLYIYCVFKVYRGIIFTVLCYYHIVCSTRHMLANSFLPHCSCTKKLHFNKLCPLLSFSVHKVKNIEVFFF